MVTSEKLLQFISSVKQALSDDTFVSMSLGNYKGLEENLEKVLIKRASVKNEVKMSFTYRYKTRDIIKNYSQDEGVAMLQTFINEGFRVATLFTTDFDLILENINNKKTRII